MIAADVFDRLLDVERRHSSGFNAKRDVMIVRGRGARVWDASGRERIDCSSGHGVASLGHAHPRIARAVAEQAAVLVTCSEAFYNDRRAELLAALVHVLPRGLDRVFLCNSGTEAVEAAIKVARFSTGRPGIVAMMRGFHGRTMGALSATWERAYRAPFEPLVTGFTHVPLNDLEAVGRAVTGETAAVVVEPVQGEGGVRPATGEFLRSVHELCRARGALLIADEVQTGFGRTGRWFACEHSGLVPDVMCLGKAIAGGLPMGATAFGPRVAALEAGLHGSTFGGNPLACAAAIAAIASYRDEGLIERSAHLGAYLLEGLRAIDVPIVREVRGIGLMAGVELRTRVTPVLRALADRGVLALPAGPTVLRLLPPLVIEREEIDIVLRAIADTLAPLGPGEARS